MSSLIFFSAYNYLRDNDVEVEPIELYDDSNDIMEIPVAVPTIPLETPNMNKFDQSIDKDLFSALYKASNSSTNVE